MLVNSPFSGECLGLLGKNGAGKTSTFKMLTGEEEISGGEAWLKGISIKDQLLRTYNQFGYCPQFDAVLGELTGLEWLQIICLIRGISPNEVKAVSRSLAHELGLEKHVQKRISKMSGGTKRKLSTAVAMIGDHRVLFLDEPTTGMDPSAKRNMWGSVTKRRHQGHSIVLTSHSMEECEALCTRLIILVGGRMKAIASSYQLKQKYTQTGFLMVQMRENETEEVQNRLTAMMMTQIQELKMKESFHGTLKFEFNSEEKLSKVFTVMEQLKEKGSIRNYSVSNQSSLVNVFLDRVGEIREEM